MKHEWKIDMTKANPEDFGDFGDVIESIIFKTEESIDTTKTFTIREKHVSQPEKEKLTEDQLFVLETFGFWIPSNCIVKVKKKKISLEEFKRLANKKKGLEV